MRNPCSYIKQLCIVGLVSLFLCYSSVAEAKWYKDYHEALESAERGDWEKTIKLLLDAIEKEPEPQENKRTYGMHFIDYYPYLKLGNAYLQIGDGKAAHEACEKSKKKGVAPEEEVVQCLRRAALFSAPTPTPGPTPTPTPVVTTPPAPKTNPTPSPDQQPETLTIKEKQQRLIELLQQGHISAEHFACAFKMLESDKSNPLLEGLLSGEISPEHFDCAFKMLESGKSNPLLEGLLSGEISPEVFNRAFSCKPQ